MPAASMTDSAAASAKLEARLLELFPELAGASRATIARIVKNGIHRKAPAGTIMFDAHAPCAGFPLLLSGTVKVLQRYPNGREMPLYRVKPGESCLLSGSCLLGHSDYTATGIAESGVEWLIVPPADFHALIASDAAFRDHVFSLFGERLAALMSLVEAIAYQKLDQRLATLLLRKKDPVRETHQALADELGSVREMVSRLLRVFEDKGWVDLARERIRIVDRRALEALATA
jgi:CRP/FNR family transcriptional regulator